MALAKFENWLRQTLPNLDLRMVTSIDSRNTDGRPGHDHTFCGAGPSEHSWPDTPKIHSHRKTKNATGAVCNVTFAGVAGRRTSLFPDRYCEI